MHSSNLIGFTSFLGKSIQFWLHLHNLVSQVLWGNQLTYSFPVMLFKRTGKPGLLKYSQKDSPNHYLMCKCNMHRMRFPLHFWINTFTKPQLNFWQSIMSALPACLKIRACGTQGKSSLFNNLSASNPLWLAEFYPGSWRFWSSFRLLVGWCLCSWSRYGCAKMDYFHRFSNVPDTQAGIPSQRQVNIGMKGHHLWYICISVQNGGFCTFSAIFWSWVTPNQSILSIEVHRAALCCSSKELLLVMVT